MTQHPTTLRRTRRRVRLAACFTAGALILTACGSGSAESDGEVTPSSTTTSRKVTRALCDAAIDAADAASNDLAVLAGGHIDAFNAAIDAIDAWEIDDQETFTAKAAEFRAFAANEENQAARIEADRASVRRTEAACREALADESLTPACEQAIDLLAAWREHTYELIAAADALYAAGEQLIRGAEADNQSMIDAALSQIDATGTAWDAGLADDDARYDDAQAALKRCRKTETSRKSSVISPPSVGTPAGQ